MTRAVCELVAESRRDHALEVAGAEERAELAEERALAAEVEASLLRQELREVEAQRDLLAERCAKLEAHAPGPHAFDDHVDGCTYCSRCGISEACMPGVPCNPRTAVAEERALRLAKTAGRAQ